MRYLLELIFLVFSTLVLWIDSVTPLGLAIWLLYYFLIAIISVFEKSKIIFIYTTLFSFFIVIGGFLSNRPEQSIAFVIENRGAAIIILWILTCAFYSKNSFIKKTQMQAISLENMNRDLESFAYTVSHDLKNPLTVIGSFNNMLLDSPTLKIDSDEYDMLKKISSETQRMNELIADLLRLSRIRRQEIKRERINLSNIAHTSFEELKRSQISSKLYEFSVEPELIDIADPGLLRILFDNLIGNAIKFSSTKESPVIEFKKIQKTGSNVYYVKDNGVGFDMKKARRLFDPFTRLHSAKDFAGTGIGLSIVRKIVENHGGKIWAESTLGDGAIFYFTLKR